MDLPTQQKIDRVQDIKGRIERSTIAMTTRYSGISVNQMIELRRAMKAGGVDFTIVKNTLLSLAADGAQKPQLKEIIDGPTAIALGYDDPVEAAKAMADFIRTGDVHQVGRSPAQANLVSHALGSVAIAHRTDGHSDERPTAKHGQRPRSPGAPVRRGRTSP